MNYADLCAAFITRFTNPLYQTKIENDIKKIKPDLEESSYATAIMNVNIQYDNLEMLLDHRDGVYLKDLYLHILPTT